MNGNMGNSMLNQEFLTHGLPDVSYRDGHGGQMSQQTQVRFGEEAEGACFRHQVTPPLEAFSSSCLLSYELVSYFVFDLKNFPRRQKSQGIGAMINVQKASVLVAHPTPSAL